MSITVEKKIWTKTLNAGALTIDKNFGFVEVSVLLTVGTGTFKGQAFSNNGIASDPLALSVGQPITVGSGTNVLLDGIEITTTGTVLIVAR